MAKLTSIPERGDSVAKLTNLRRRVTCAHCGARGVYDFEDSESMSVGTLPIAALRHGWVVLNDTLMCLCPQHAGAIKYSTIDEIKFLAARLDAFERAALFHLPFIVLGERLISENDERLATSAEIAMWQVIAGARPFQVQETK